MKATIQPDLSQEIVILTGNYYVPLWIAPRTGNIGFIAALELISETRSGAQAAQREYAASFLKHWHLRPTKSVLRLIMPTDRELYPLFKITDGAYILPFACVKGPMYDEQMQLREAHVKPTGSQ